MHNKSFFQNSLSTSQPEIAKIINQELARQQNQIELIASENIVSKAVLEAQGSVLTNKYAEGYPGKRYYGGCEFVDQIEQMAIDAAKKLYSCEHANVQPHSGSQANQAIFLSLLEPGDSILGMDLSAGGHLTHGSKVNISGKWFKAHQYGVSKETGLIDEEEVLKIAKECRPKLIIAGGSAYPRIINFAKFRQIADEVGALLLVDMAHYAGLIATGFYPSPFPHAHVATTTTHKTLRGPRGGMILTNDETLAKKFNSAIFPGLQGGPLMHVIAGKAVAFKEAQQPEFKQYISNVMKNASILAETLKNRGLNIVTGGTDSHLILVDLRPKGVTGKAAEKSLESAGLTCNKNSIPFDPESPFVTSGIRLGSPAATSRGFGEKEFEQVANLIGNVIDGLSKSSDNSMNEEKTLQEVLKLCKEFPIYSYEK